MANSDHDPYALAYPETRPFWQAAEQGKFIVPRCQECGKCHWHPRGFCPMCGSPDIEWIDAKGTGTIFSYSVIRSSPEPYSIAYVELDEGPLLITNIVNCNVDLLHIGQAVRVSFQRATEGRCMPVFSPAKD